MVSTNSLAMIIFCEQINGKCMVHNKDDVNFSISNFLQKLICENGDTIMYNWPAIMPNGYATNINTANQKNVQKHWVNGDAGRR